MTPREPSTGTGDKDDDIEPGGHYVKKMIPIAAQKHDAQGAGRRPSQIEVDPPWSHPGLEHGRSNARDWWQFSRTIYVCACKACDRFD